MEIIGYLGALLIGLILGLIGSGGSVLAVPILTYLFLFDEKIATAYSLFIVGTTSFIGGINFFFKKLINWNQVFLFGIPSIVSVVLVRYFIIPEIPEVIFNLGQLSITRRLFILGLFSVLLIFSSFFMLNDYKISKKKKNYIKIIFEGFVVGGLTGLIGAGGGFLIIPSLVILGKIPMKEAVGTSLVIIAFKSLSGFFLGDAILYNIDWIFLFKFVLISIFGILIGNYFSYYIDSKILKKIFALFILIIGVFIILYEFLNL
jgi:uncharacterized protein